MSISSLWSNLSTTGRLLRGTTTTIDYDYIVYNNNDYNHYHHQQQQQHHDTPEVSMLRPSLMSSPSISKTQPRTDNITQEQSISISMMSLNLVDNNKTTTTTTTTVKTASNITAAPAAASSTTTSATTILSKFKSMINKSTLDIPIEMYQNKTSPVQDLLKVYIYDTLPSNLSTNLIQDIIHSRHDHNLNTDVVLINLFETFPGRTYNPDEADIFVVPYPHVAHCHGSEGYALFCQHVNEEDTTAVLQYLKYYNPYTEHKHLFLLGDGETQAQDWFMETPLIAQYGPLWHGNNRPGQRKKKYRKSSPPGHIIVPPFNSQPEFQPSFVMQRLHEKQNQQKVFSLTSVAGTVNKRMGKRTGRIYRKYFHDELQQWTNISGMPFISSDHVTDGGANTLYEKYYPNSILCPVLPGDTTWQRRFFDVMACGCLPLVVSYPVLPNSKKQVNRTSWFLPDPRLSTQSVFNTDVWSVEETHPFTDTIDYSSFVIECPGNYTHPSDMSHIVPACIENLISNHAEIIKQKQDALQQSVVKVLYGVGPDAHVYDDAFAQLIRSLRHYLNKHALAKKKKKKKRKH